jgi:hypothetical protein
MNCLTSLVPKDTGEIRQYEEIFSCATRFPWTPATIVDQQVEIISRLVSSLAIFLKRGELVSILCGGRIRTSKAHQKLEGEFIEFCYL